MPLQPGERLGPYEILAPIGAGGMGDVYKAHDPRLRRDVAIKVSAQRFSERFEREAQAIAALNHPNICQVYDVGPDYLVMEFIQGYPLKGPLPLEKALEYAGQIASALDATHERNITHRDLKPANILVTASGIKLLDFGLAKVTPAQSPEGTTQIMPLTEAGSVMGTPAYMSPEQARGEEVDARSDVFSFGVVLYEMLSGRHAFARNSSIETMAAILRDEPAALDAPTNVSSIVTRCLRKSPTDRFQAISEVRAALQHAAARPAEKQPSIAVLPFANMSADKENEYFSDGLAEEILNLLAKIPGLKVIARTSAFAFRGKEQDVREIAEALGVSNVLEGSVRRSGSRLRITAQLINASDGYHLWSQRYDREMVDLFDLQDEIAQAIASALQVKLSGASSSFMQYKPSLPAYEALLKARHYRELFRPDLLPRARDYFEQAISLDPKFALAHCEYGVYFVLTIVLGLRTAKEGYSMVRSQARKALDLDPSLPEGHAMMGTVAGFLEHDWKEAERCFRLAMAHDPVPIIVRLYYSFYLLLIGRPAEAFQQTEFGMQEDPLSVLLRINRASYLVAAGRDEDAAEEYRAILELNPSMVLALFNMASRNASLGELDQALRLCEEAYALAPLPRVIGLLAGLLKRTGDTHRAEELLGKLRPADAIGVPMGLAIYHWALREFDAEADWIEKTIDQQDPVGIFLLRMWYGRELRSTPRWAGFMRKLNLPES